MGSYTDGLAKRIREKRGGIAAHRAEVTHADPWVRRKMQRNLKDGYNRDKGLRDGRCNRYACQEPLGANPLLSRPRPQWSMRDHESSSATHRLYYCHPCAVMFNDSDARAGTEQRCRRET